MESVTVGFGPGLRFQPVHRARLQRLMLRGNRGAEDFLTDLDRDPGSTCRRYECLPM